MSTIVRRKSQILSTEDNSIYCANGDFLVAYKIDYPEKYSSGENDFEEIHSDWMKAIQQLPIGTIILKSDVYKKIKFSTADLPNETFLQKAANRHFDGRGYINHSGYIFFIQTKKDTKKIESLKNPFVFPSLKNFKTEDLDRKAFYESVKNVEAYFTDLSLKLIPMQENEIYALEDFYFNGFQNEYTSDLIAESNRLKFGNTNIGVITLDNERKFPSNISTSIKDSGFSSEDFIFHQGFMDSFGLNLQCNHIYNQIIYLDDHNKHVESIHTNLDYLNKSKGISQFNASGAKILEKVLDELQDDIDLQFVRGHSNIVFWSDDEDEFQYIRRNIIKNFTALSFKPNEPTRERLKATFYNTIFTNISFLDINSCYVVGLTAAIALFVNNSNYKSDEKGIMLQERIFNLPVLYDFWDEGNKVISSRNMIIVGATGRGKSFTFNYLLQQLVAQGIIVVIIDLGDSYLKLSKLFPPEHVEVFKYKEGEPLGLNPFLLDEPTPSSLKIEELAEFVWTLIKKEGDPTELEQTSMRKLITYYYKMEEDNHSWESFYRFIEHNKDTLYNQLDINNEEFFKLEEFLHAGSDFIGSGAYANLLKKTDKSQNFVGKKLIIFELDEVKDNKLLLTILLQVISEAIQKVIWKDRKTKGLVLFEEFGKQLEFPNVLRKVKYYAQAIRKFNGSLSLVLQTLNQMPDTPEAKTIMDQTETFVFLPSKSHKDTFAKLDLSTHNKNQLNSVQNKHTGEGYRYSEILIDRSKRTNVYRIEASPEEYIAFQTQGDLHTDVMELYEKTGDMEEAINLKLKELKL